VSLHPCLKVTNAASGIFNYDACSYVVYLDRKPVFTASKLSTALAGLFCLYFVFGVEYPRCMRNTCVFFVWPCSGVFRTPVANCPDSVQQAILLKVFVACPEDYVNVFVCC
jgi:hypothetical protein